MSRGNLPCALCYSWPKSNKTHLISVKCGEYTVVDGYGDDDDDVVYALLMLIKWNGKRSTFHSNV